MEDVDADPVVIVDGLTKNWRYPGLRLSWTVGPRSVIERVASAGSFLDGGAPHLLQRAAVPLLQPDPAEAEARSIQRAFTAKRDFALARLSTMGLTDVAPCGGAFYLFVNLGGLPAPLCDGMAFFEAALEAKVICVPGALFDVDPYKRREHLSRLQQFVRLSFGPSRTSCRRSDRLIIDVALTPSPARSPAPRRRPPGKTGTAPPGGEAVVEARGGPGGTRRPRGATPT